MVNDGDLRCTTVTLLTSFSVGFSGFLGSPFSTFSWYNAVSRGGASASHSSLSVSCPFLAILDGLSERLGDSCDDWLCDRLLSPPSGVCLGSCSVDRRNLFNDSLRTSECDFFFFFFKDVDGPTPPLRSSSSSTGLRFRPVSATSDGETERERISGQFSWILPGFILIFEGFNIDFSGISW